LIKDNSQSLHNPQTIWSRIGLFLIFVFALCYSNLLSNFAEWHIQLLFLDFPIFVGEMLLMVSFVLLYLHWRENQLKFQRWHYIALGFIIWLLIKAIHGYIVYGPLAFRNAAFFYYIIFGFIGYYFFDKKMLTENVTYVLLLTIFIVLNFWSCQTYFKYSYIAIGVILAFRVRNISIKLLFFLALLVSFPYEYMLGGPRSHVVAILCISLYLLVTVFFMVNIKKRIKFVILIFSIIAILFGVQKFTDENKIKSITEVHQFLNTYEEKLQELAVNSVGYEFKPIKPALFHKNSSYVSEQEVDHAVDYVVNEHDVNSEIEAILAQKFGEAQLEYNEIIKKYVKAYKEKIIASNEIMDGYEEDANVITELILQEILDDILKVHGYDPNNLKFKNYHNLSKRDKWYFDLISDSKGRLKELQSNFEKEIAVGFADRPMDVELGNIVFRLFIWQDMIEEIISERSYLWGINFGKPQRSKRIEITGWAKGEWERDGWITPHNSLIHYYYRGGIVGLAIVSGMIWFLILATNICMKSKSYSGIALISILLYWICISIFLVILELPYNAIPFWSLFGITIAYCQNLKNSVSNVS